MTTQSTPESAEPAPKMRHGHTPECSGELEPDGSGAHCDCPGMAPVDEDELDEPAPVATDTQAREGTTALRGPLTTKGTRVRVNLPESENHGAEGHIVAHDAKTPEYEWRVQFDESRRDDGDVWFRTDQLVPVGDPATPAPAGDAEVSQCPGCTSGRAEQCELRDGHAELSHEEAMDCARHYAGRDSMLFRYASQQEARQRQAEQRIAEYKASEADWREKLRGWQSALQMKDKAIEELRGSVRHHRVRMSELLNAYHGVDLDEPLTLDAIEKELSGENGLVASKEAGWALAKSRLDALQGKDEAIAELQAKLEDVRTLQKQLEEEGGRRNGSQRVWSIAGDISSILRGDDAWKNRDTTSEAAEFAAASRESHPPVAETQVIAELQARLDTLGRQMATAVDDLSYSVAQRYELSRKLEALTEDRRAQRVKAADAEIALTEERSLTAELRGKLEEAELSALSLAADVQRAEAHGRVSERDSHMVRAAQRILGGAPAQPPPAKPLTPDDVRAIAREVIAEVAERAFERLNVECYPSTQTKYLAEAAKEENGD